LYLYVGTYSQECRRCLKEATTVRSYPYEDLRLAEEFVAKLEQNEFGRSSSSVKKQQRSSKPFSSHRKDLCYACMAGACFYTGNGTYRRPRRRNN